MSAHRHYSSSREGTARPPVYGVELDCRKWVAERRRIAALPLWRRMLGRA